MLERSKTSASHTIKSVRKNHRNAKFIKCETVSYDLHQMAWHRLKYNRWNMVAVQEITEHVETIKWRERKKSTAKSIFDASVLSVKVDLISTKSGRMVYQKGAMQCAICFTRIFFFFSKAHLGLYHLFVTNANKKNTHTYHSPFIATWNSGDCMYLLRILLTCVPMFIRAFGVLSQQ